MHPSLSFNLLRADVCRLWLGHWSALSTVARVPSPQPEALDVSRGSPGCEQRRLGQPRFSD